ncbi:superoxide dismutase family protein [Sphingosinicella terrae]|uniref:superoxide dismutase family protein n=1 Tax=Sphingosinicella terrae TaxID=2172047 RepID=UPI0013B46FDE|nr:superoxide dismutase family protein [Sphingosinicella terrae]
MRSSLMAIAIAMGLAGCGSPQSQEGTDAAANAGDAANAGMNAPEASAQRAVATLQTAEGAAAGTATASAVDGGIRIALEVEGLPPGPHGAHVHMTGRCDAPAFESAGGHWNPTDAQHGLEAPPGQHAGDMPNLDVGADGRGSLDYTLQGGSFEGLMDADGSTMMIHADADDQRTDPSGNSGGRIACGVFQAG